MRKYLISFITVIISVYILSAQTKVGIHAGINTIEIEPSQLILKNQADIDEFAMDLEKTNFGFHFGLFLIAKGKFVFMKPQVQFNSQTVSYRLQDYKNSDSLQKILKETYQQINVPLQVGVHFGPIRLGAGPVGHFNINTDSEINSELGDSYEIRFSNFSLGYILGLGIDIWNFHIDFGYEGNLSKFGDHIVYKDREFSFDDRPARFIGSIGISF